jgi:hypothetical protein
VEQALAAAEKRLRALERHLDEPHLMAGSTVTGPIGDIIFVPGWGDVYRQLWDQNLPSSLRGSREYTAIMVAYRLDGQFPSAWTIVAS